MHKILFRRHELTIEEQQIRSTGKRQKRLGQMLLPYLLVLPTFIFLSVFAYYPIGNLVYLSFRKYNMISVDKYVAWRNYNQLFNVSTDFKAALTNTALFTFVSMALILIFSMLMGLSLQKNRRMNSLAKRAMFFPHIVSGVSISMIFAWLLNAQNGLFNQALQMVGLPTLKWLDSSQTALPSVIGINVWKAVGYYTLIILAALGGIPSEINEAAELDNTPAWRKFFKITFPMLSPQLFFMLVNITIGSFKVFDLVRLLTNGGPGTATYVLVLYIYRYAFEWSLQIGYACAAGVVLMVILLVMTVLYFKLLEKRVHYQ